MSRNTFITIMAGLLLVLAARPAQAQREYYNWYFGDKAGVTFTTGTPVFLPGNQHVRPFSPLTASNGTGVLQLSGEDTALWDQTEAPMPGNMVGNCSNGTTLGIYSAALVVPQPGRPGRFYILRHSLVSYAPGGCIPRLQYQVVDMGQRSGLGEVIEADSLPGQMWRADYGALTAVRHANGRDLWIISQNRTTDQYWAWLLTPGGWQGAPVLSGILKPYTNYFFNTLVQLKASPDGRHLISAKNRPVPPKSGNSSALKYTCLELADFSSTTGIVSQSRMLPDSLRGNANSSLPLSSSFLAGRANIGGLEFSPDGSHLYADTVGGHEVWQYSLLAGSPAAIAASRQSIPVATSGELNDLQLGPDGNLYVSAWGSQYLAQLTNTNAPAAAVHYNPQAVNLQNAACQFALPRGANDLNIPPVAITSAGAIATATSAGCLNEPIVFQSSLSPFIAAAAYSWSFGDPGSGLANQAAGQAPSHIFALAGSYTVHLQVTASSGQVFTTQQAVQVLAPPQATLGVDSTLCYSAARQLSPGPQPAGTTYRWQDGSTNATFAAARPGQYSVEVTNASGCKTKTAIRLVATDCAYLPNVITPNGDALNQSFVLNGLNAADWSISIYNRWGREIYRQVSYDNSWDGAGHPAGTYYYLLRNSATGKSYRGWLEVAR